MKIKLSKFQLFLYVKLFSVIIIKKMMFIVPVSLLNKTKREKVSQKSQPNFQHYMLRKLRPGQKNNGFLMKSVQLQLLCKLPLIFSRVLSYTDHFGLEEQQLIRIAVDNEFFSHMSQIYMQQNSKVKLFCMKIFS